MENQHRQIKGYRELSQVEIDIMNEIKGLGLQLEAATERVSAHILQQRKNAGGLAFDELKAEVDRLNAASPERFAAMAKTEFQTGLMYLTRAVAQPTSF